MIKPSLSESVSTLLSPKGQGTVKSQLVVDVRNQAHYVDLWNFPCQRLILSPAYPCVGSHPMLHLVTVCLALLVHTSFCLSAPTIRLVSDILCGSNR